MLTEFGPRYPRQYPWKRLKSVAGPEFATLNTGGSITRGTAEWRASHPRKQSSSRAKSRTVKAFAAGAKAFPNSPWCLTPKAALPRSFTVCSQPLAAQACSLRPARSLFGFGTPARETRSKLRNRCAEVRCCSWSQREGKLSDRKTGMCCKRVVDHKIPALASSLAQG